MVGDIIQDPLGNLVGGALAAGAWAVKAVWDIQYETFQRTSAYGEQFLNGFTTDDLVDVPPPPAEDLGTVTPDTGAGGSTTTTTSPSDYTWSDYVKDQYVQEQKRGIQSPLGPEDPNVALAPVSEQQQPKDPQAPLKPGFNPSPQPAPRSTAGANLIFRSWIGANTPWVDNPASEPDTYTWPTFRGKQGAKKNISTVKSNVFAIPRYTDDGVKWTARVQTLRNNEVTATWEFDAGDKAPSGSEFRLLIQSAKMTSPDNIYAFNFPQLGAGVQSIPLTESSAPELIPLPPWSPDVTPPPITPDSAQPSDNWTPVNTSNESDTNSDLDREDVTYPPQRFPRIPKIPVLPPGTIPINPNNAITEIAPGVNGLPIPGKGLVPTTSNSTHKVGDSLVNSGGMRGDIASVAKEVGRIEQKTANVARSIFDFIDSADDILEILEKFLPPQKTPAKELSMNAFCDKTEEGEPLTMSIAYPEEEILPAIISRLDDIPAWLEQHLAWKTPTCTNEKPPLLGSWVTSRWLSDGDSPNGGRRLRKLFRYRTQSTRTNEELSGFWDGFTWQAGPILVEHRGAWWGNPACWAIDEAEGKRLIRNAAREAGLNPDLDGEWFVGASRSPRIGMTGTMRLAPLGRWNHVVSRDGSDGYPNDS